MAYRQQQQTEISPAPNEDSGELGHHPDHGMYDSLPATPPTPVHNMAGLSMPNTPEHGKQRQQQRGGQGGTLAPVLTAVITGPQFADPDAFPDHAFDDDLSLPSTPRVDMLDVDQKNQSPAVSADFPDAMSLHSIPQHRTSGMPSLPSTPEAGARGSHTGFVSEAPSMMPSPRGSTPASNASRRNLLSRGSMGRVMTPPRAAVPAPLLEEMRQRESMTATVGGEAGTAGSAEPALEAGAQLFPHIGIASEEEPPVEGGNQSAAPPADAAPGEETVPRCDSADTATAHLDGADAAASGATGSAGSDAAADSGTSDGDGAAATADGEGPQPAAAHGGDVPAVGLLPGEATQELHDQQQDWEEGGGRPVENLSYVMQEPSFGPPVASASETVRELHTPEPGEPPSDEDAAAAAAGDAAEATAADAAATAAPDAGAWDGESLKAAVGGVQEHQANTLTGELGAEGEGDQEAAAAPAAAEEGAAAVAAGLDATGAVATPADGAADASATASDAAVAVAAEVAVVPEPPTAEPRHASDAGDRPEGEEVPGPLEAQHGSAGEGGIAPAPGAASEELASGSDGETGLLMAAAAADAAAVAEDEDEALQSHAELPAAEEEQAADPAEAASAPPAAGWVEGDAGYDEECVTPLLYQPLETLLEGDEEGLDTPAEQEEELQGADGSTEAAGVAEGQPEEQEQREEAQTETEEAQAAEQTQAEVEQTAIVKQTAIAEQTATAEQTAAAEQVQAEERTEAGEQAPVAEQAQAEEQASAAERTAAAESVGDAGAGASATGEGGGVEDVPPAPHRQRQQSLAGSLPEGAIDVVAYAPDESFEEVVIPAAPSPAETAAAAAATAATAAVTAATAAAAATQMVVFAHDTAVAATAAAAAALHPEPSAASVAVEDCGSRTELQQPEPHGLVGEPWAVAATSGDILGLPAAEAAAAALPLGLQEHQHQHTAEDEVQQHDEVQGTPSTKTSSRRPPVVAPPAPPTDPRVSFPLPRSPAAALRRIADDAELASRMAEQATELFEELLQRKQWWADSFIPRVFPKNRVREDRPAPVCRSATASPAATSVGQDSSSDNPALINHQRSQLGSQIESHKRSAPSISFVKGPRFMYRHDQSTGPPSIQGGQRQQQSSGDDGRQGPATWDPLGGAQRETLAASASERASGGSPLKLPDINSHRGGAFTTFGNEQRFGDMPPRAAAGIPGPGTYRLNTPSKMLSTQHDAGIAGATKFRTAGRDHFVITKEVSKTFYGIESPGPIYKPTSGDGHPEGGARFTTGPRLQKHISPVSPGPAAYGMHSLDAAMKMTRVEHRGTFSFGGASRDKAALVSLTGQLAEAAAGRDSLGPAHYEVDVTVESRFRSPAAVCFPAANRFHYVPNEAPGPGAYVV